MSSHAITGHAETSPPILSDQRERQRHVMRWILLVVVVLLMMGWVAIGIVHGPSAWTVAGGGPVGGIFAWLVLDQFRR